MGGRQPQMQRQQRGLRQQAHGDQWESCSQ
jgi:hypothetical protein